MIHGDPPDDERPECWAGATAPIPAGYITLEQVAALTGYTGDEPSTRDLTFPLAADTAQRCKLLRPPDAAGDPCACGVMFQRFPSCELLRAIDAGGSFRAEDHAEPGACAGLAGRCPECIMLYLLLVGPKSAVCMPCGHRHWPWEAHADHQWRDACPYEGTACDPAAGKPMHWLRERFLRGPAPRRSGGVRYEPDEDPEEDPIGVHASDGSLAYPDDPMPVNVQPLPPSEPQAAGGCAQRPGEQCPHWNPADNRRCAGCVAAAVAGDHPPVGCDGLAAGCGYCIRLYLNAQGLDMQRDDPPHCVACDSVHWPWQPNPGTSCEAIRVAARSMIDANIARQDTRERLARRPWL